MPTDTALLPPDPSANGEPVADVMDEKLAVEREEFRSFLADQGPRGVEALANYDRAMRDVDTGHAGARNAWHSITPAQRRVLVTAAARDGRVQREGKEYRHAQGHHQLYRPFYVATLRPLCERGLMAWDGGAFDPEAAAVLTERGRFVVMRGQ
jgi:hypothetical protein